MEFVEAGEDLPPSAALCILTFNCESHWHRQHQSPGMSRDSEPEVEGEGEGEDGCVGHLSRLVSAGLAHACALEGQLRLRPRLHGEWESQPMSDWGQLVRRALLGSGDYTGLNCSVHHHQRTCAHSSDVFLCKPNCCQRALNNSTTFIRTDVKHQKGWLRTPSLEISVIKRHCW